MSEGGARLAALAGAVGLVVVALVVRGRIDGGDGGGSGGDGDRTLVCPSELAEVCERAFGDGGPDVRIEEASATADRLTGARTADELGDAGDIDLWLTTRPWVDAVTDARDRANEPRLVSDPAGPVARSPVALVVWESRAAALEETACRGAIGWRCLGDVADRPWTEAGGEASWGRVRAGLADPGSAAGLPVLGGAVAGYLERSDYATNDFDGNLSAWLSGLAVTAGQGTDPGDDPIARMLTRGPGEFAALGVLEADAATAIGGRDDVRVIVPEPVVTADLVVVAVGEAGGDRGAAEDVAGDGDLRGALHEAGWRVADREPIAGADPDVELPARDDGLPSGPVLRALLDRWLELL